MRRIVGILLCLAPVWWFFLWLLEEKLTKAGILNAKDMTFVGNETGSLMDYVLNGWHWDLALMILLAIALLCPLIGVFILASGRGKSR